MSIPKVFISYSHDSQEHKKWVLDFATRLRNTGIDAIIDQWELKPGDDLPHFMETHLENSDYIVMICTEKYVAKANSGVGGVGYEKMVITSDLLQSIDNNKVIPVIRQNGTCAVPTFLKTKLFINFSLTESFEFSYDELIRTLHKSPLYIKPEIGNNPFTSIKNIQAEKTSDALRELMSVLVSDFENGANYSLYRGIKERTNISRIMLDIMIQEAIDKNLIYLDETNDLCLTSEGKHYAIEHKLV